MPPTTPMSWGVCRTTQVSNSSSCKLIFSSVATKQSLLISSSSFVSRGKKGGWARLRRGKKKENRKGKKVRQTHRYEIVTVPPEQLSILNEDGTSHIPYYILGPYTEGASLNITCDATGGKYSCFTYPSLPVSLRSPLVSLDRRRVFRVSVCSCGNACTRMSSPILPSLTFRCNHVGLGSLSIYWAMCNVCKHMVSACRSTSA